MKALLFFQHGDLEQVRFKEISIPKLEPGQVLVKTQVAALNHLDLFVLRGLPGLRLEMPHIPGSDAAGVVEDVGEKVNLFSKGDRVMLNPVISCGKCEFCLSEKDNMCVKLRLIGEHTKGTFAEYFVVPESNLKEIPKDISFEDAASFSLVFMTAWHMLKTRAQIKTGDDVFVHGIGGGVSTAALKIIKHCGCRVFVSSSSREKLIRAKEMGADYCFRYDEVEIVTEVMRITGKRGVDVVVDSVGAATWRQSLQLIKKGGRIVTCGATTGFNSETDIRLIFWKQIDILGSTMGNRHEYLKLLKLLGDRALVPTVDRVYPLSEGKRALQYLQNQQQFGKVLLRP